MLRMFSEANPPKKARTLAEHLKKAIEQKYILASTVTKWMSWIGQTGITRAKTLIEYLDKQDDKTDEILAREMILNLRHYRKGSHFEDSKNLRVLVANEMCRYMGVDMNDLRIELSDEIANHLTPHGLMKDSRYIETDVALKMLIAKINKQSAPRPSMAIK